MSDDRLARIPELVEYLKAQGDLWDGKLWEAAEALEAVQARIAALTREADRADAEHRAWQQCQEYRYEAEQRAERYRAALDFYADARNWGHGLVDEGEVARQALAPDPACPTPEEVMPIGPVRAQSSDSPSSGLRVGAGPESPARPATEPTYKHPTTMEALDYEPCGAGWAGCDSYTGGHVCTLVKGHTQRRHRCDCGVTTKRTGATESDDA